jgi:hypothetical protein
MFESVSKPAAEKEPEKLGEKEILDIIHIVDWGPMHLDKITPENIKEIIEKGEQLLKERRAETNNSLIGQPSSPSEALMEAVIYRSSQSHAIQCPINKIEDFKFFQHYLNQYAAEHKIEKTNENFDYINRFFKRHIEINELLSRLYEIDIARRIGVAKNEEKFFQQEAPLFAKNLIKKSLAEFEETNKEKVEELRTKLQEASYEDFKKDFYKICQSFSQLIFDDFEQFNKENLKKAVKNLRT